MKNGLILLFILLLFSTGCAKKDEVVSAIEEAQYLLSLNPARCEDAIDVLEDVDPEAADARFIQAMASAYACRGGFSVLNLFDDIDTIDPTWGTFFGSLTLLASSEESEVNSTEYLALKQAIETVLYAGGATTSSASARITDFGSAAGNLNLQAMYMILVQMGKYFHFYGNVDSTGVKGAGAASVDEQSATASTCIFKYTGIAQAYVTSGASTGSCNNVADEGHPDLSGSAPDLPTTITRMCEGVILLNNLLDILSNVTLSANDSIGDIGDISASVTAVTQAMAALYPQMQPILDETDQADCEAYAITGSNFDHLQIYFATIFESGLL